MEGIKELNDDLDKIEQEVQSVKEAVCKLNCKFVEEANFIRRTDRISALEELKERLFKEIDSILDAEDTAKINFKFNKVLSGVSGFIGGAVGAAFVKRKDPLSIGKEVGRELYKQKEAVKLCFGNIMAVTKDFNKPEDIQVVSISQIARERSMTEAMVIAGYKDNGYTVLTPEQLKQHLDKLIEDTKNNTPTIYLKKRPVAVQPVK